MRILLFGSKGFIGSHVLQSMKEHGYLVYGCDVVEASEENYCHYQKEKDLVDLFSNNGFDLCINCAGAASVPDSMKNPLHDFELNVNLISKLLFYISRYQPKCKLIQLSSAAVYGNPQHLPVKEDSTLAPVSPYGCHKLMAEELCEMYHRVFGVESAIVRIFSAYGPGLRKQLFWDLYQKTLSGKEQIELFGTGNESRDFIFAGDIANALHCVIQRSTFNAEVINLANGIEITIQEAATVFLDLLGYKGKVLFTNDQRQGDPVNWRADMTRLTGYGYTPQVSFKQGLEKYIAWLNLEKK